MTSPVDNQHIEDTAPAERARTVLIRVVKVAFPHTRVPDGPYERTADAIIAQASPSSWFGLALTQGLHSLDGLAGGDFCSLDDDQAYKLLKRIEGTDFFGFIRRTTVITLYDDPEVWAALGWEGSSYEKGGYINRGFNDLDWLPEPRIEEYDGPVTFEPIAEVPGTTVTNGNVGAAATTAAAAADDEVRDNLKATLSTQQDPRERTRPSDNNSQKANV